MSDLGNSAWNEVDSSNNATPPNGWPAGMNPSQVEPAARAMMGALKRAWDRGNTTATTDAGGTSTAYTLTYSVAAAAYYSGEEFGFYVDKTCGATPSLNVKSPGAAVFRKFVGGAWNTLAAGDLVALQALRVAYNSSVPSFDIVASSNFFPPTTGTTTFLTSGVTLNNTASFFNGPNTGSIGATGQTWLIMANAQMQDGVGSALFEAVISNGSSNIADTIATSSGAGASLTISLAAVVTLTAATTFTLQVKDQTSTGGLLAASGSATANKATSITAIRLS